MTTAAPMTSSVPAPSLLQPAAAGLALAVAAAGSLLPWEHLTVATLGQPATTTGLGAFHGTGIAAVLGVAVALLGLADALRRGTVLPVHRAALSAAGVLLGLGAALFTATGGIRPGSGAGWSVAIAPGLYLSGLGGTALLAVLAAPAWWRRAESRRRTSGGGP